MMNGVLINLRLECCLLFDLFKTKMLIKLVSLYSFHIAS